MTFADDVDALIDDDLTAGGGTATGTYDDTNVGGSVTLTDQTAIERNRFQDDGSGRATMEVLIQASVLSSPLVGATWNNGDGRGWRVYAISDVNPLFSSLYVEAHLGTGSQT